ncbi:thymidine phosphorylase [Pseudomonas sp. 1D4]|uniref:DUF1631 domain-containing protein n=1 Tax=Pseudomonadaceae TaxID=135621 RepID=UPI00084B4F33|nr:MULTISPECIES: DUF1631 domain-containing protein [Pseudomonas]OEC38823.1 thymidine phosphorylase [Pseudomonas sp. 1D4]OEC61022.1 thymidine phosphorylase [Pseudomonas sp. ENNP23]
MSRQDTPPPPRPVATLANRGIQPRFGDLVQGCRKLVMNQLAEHLTGVFAQVDDTLFECAEKAENNQVQTLFFDSMREIRRQRPQIERLYHQRIAQQFGDFMEGREPEAKVTQLDADHLELVQNEVYEESLLVTNMVSRVKARCAQPLFALDQRLALLNNGRKLGEDSNPFGPQAIAQSFRDALQNMPFPLRIKTILYMLFDQQVMQGLDGLYEALNNRLIDAGVLPNLKYTAQRQATPAKPQPREPAPRPESPAPSAPGPAAPPADLSAPPPQEPGALYSGLSALLEEHRRLNQEAGVTFTGTPSIISYAPQGATRTYSAADLLEALNRLQQQSAHDLASRLQQPQRVEGLKADLHQQLESHSTQPGQQKVAEQEADVIDLVGMLFDFILDDDSLPDTCKTALSHLHTPYLKVALQDKALFTQHHHPARRLLNTMAQAGALYGGESEEKGLLAKMQWVVERVIHGFAGDLQLFDTLQDEFNEYVATLRHKVELRERRAVEAAKGRDRLLEARQRSVDAIARLLEGRELPKIIRHFLEQTWSDVLVFVLLRHGDAGEEWRRACEVADQLAWSGTPLDARGRERLQGLRVGMLEDLRKGLELLGGYHEDGIRRLLQDLVACQHAVQGKQPQVAAHLNPELPKSPLSEMLGEDAGLVERRTVALSARAQALVKELESLEFNTWFEFVEDGQSRTLKLSWYSPTTRNYMFVDHSGQRVAIKPITQLAQDMERGNARIVAPDHNVPLMDRALGAIYRVLQRFTGRTPRAN